MISVLDTWGELVAPLYLLSIRNNIFLTYKTKTMNIYAITKRTQGTDGFGHYNKIIQTNLSLYISETDIEKRLKQLPLEIKTFVSPNGATEELPIYFITTLYVNEEEIRKEEESSETREAKKFYAYEKYSGTTDLSESEYINEYFNEIHKYTEAEIAKEESDTLSLSRDLYAMSKELLNTLTNPKFK